MREACRMAGVSPLDIEAVDCFGGPNALDDAVEVSSTLRAYRPQGMQGLADAGPLALQSLKSNTCNMIEVMGMATLIKALACCRRGHMTPSNHLRVLNPHIDFEAIDCPSFMGSELCEFYGPASFIGLSCRSTTGTNCHAIAWAKKDTDRFPQVPEAKKHDYISFWPAGELDAGQPAKSYHIVGTWNRWMPERMDCEEEGVYTYVVTLGESAQESFQVWLDGEKSQALHPGVQKARLGSKVKGPEMAIRATSWILGLGESGRPGNRYLIRLRVSGKRHMVDWELLETGPPGLEFFDKCAPSTYQVVGSWGDMDIQEMTPEPDLAGAFSVEAQLTEANANFHLIKDLDCNQTLDIDAVEVTEESRRVLEADDAANRWSLNGKAGDVFKIQFRRWKEDDKLKVTMSATIVGHRDLTEEQVANVKREKYFIIGGWNDDEPFPMRWTGQHYQFLVRMGNRKQESFQVTSGQGVYCPDVEEATTQEGFQVCGPTPKSSAKWVIGKSSIDDFAPGTVVEIRLSVNRKKLDVDWSLPKGDVDLEKAFGMGYLAWCR